MGKRWALGLALLGAAGVLALGCGDGAGGAGATDTSDVVGVDAGLDAAGDLGGDVLGDLEGDVPEVVPGSPLLERPVDLRFECQVTRDTTNHQPLRWAQGGHPLVTTVGGKTFLARVESEPTTPFDLAPAFLRVSTLDAAGDLGTGVDLDATSEAVTGVGAAPAGEGLLVVWAEGALKAALLDGEGQTLGQAVNLGALPGGDYMTRPVVAALGDGFGVGVSVPANSHRTIRFLRLDAAAAAVGTPVEFTTGGASWDNPGLAVAAGDGRWGLLWQETVDNKGQIFFAAVDAQGQIVVNRKRIFVPEGDTITPGFVQARLALVATEEGWVAAWSEAYPGEEMGSGAWALVRVARLDANGNTLELAPVRAAVLEVDEVEPVLLPFQGAVGLFWSSGSHIYFCGGCYPDHRVDFVLLDGATLSPVSEVQTLNPTPNGLLGLSAAANGDQLLATFDIGYHVYQDPASGALECVKKN
jgi:hypothetical protein